MTEKDKNSSQSTAAAIGLGANLGAPLLNLQRALAELADAGFRSQRVSPVYLTPPVACVPGTPDFYNAAVTGLWRGTPEELRECCHAIEQRLGRPAAHGQDEARMIDLDILLFGDCEFRTPALRIPHRLLCARAFVLLPLADIAANWPVPGTAFPTVADALASRPAAETAACRRTTAILLPW
jgi:2-amino-4-hydroxy-6-hydroxymethyldihydropteridine diphosphokinase